MKNNFRFTYLLIVNLSFIFALFFVSCTNATPIIEQTQASRILNYDTVTQKTDQYFSVFCAIQDKDGIQDVDSMYILDDSKKLLWHIGGSMLKRQNIANRTWFGSNHLNISPGEPFPTGRLRIIVYDRSGNKAQADAGLPILDHDPEKDIPRITRDSTTVSIRPTLTGDTVDREVVAKDWSQVEVGRVRVLENSAPFTLVAPGRNPQDTKLVVNDIYFGGSLLIISGPW